MTWAPKPWVPRELRLAGDQKTAYHCHLACVIRAPVSESAGPRHRRGGGLVSGIADRPVPTERPGCVGKRGPRGATTLRFSFDPGDGRSLRDTRDGSEPLTDRPSENVAWHPGRWLRAFDPFA